MKDKVDYYRDFVPYDASQEWCHGEGHYSKASDHSYLQLRRSGIDLALDGKGNALEGAGSNLFDLYICEACGARVYRMVRA